ncbi:4-azaleucine resistance transporter AzlC [Paenibacillus wynnii]|nr:4-azaleucine resistance transporter AzlC [Paenibacillus wynnii]
MKINTPFFRQGLVDSIPIVIGYIPACLTFGLVGKAMSLSSWEVFLLSAFVYAGASQFIGAKLLAAGAAAPVILLVTFIINLRYLFISMSFSQKVPKSLHVIQRSLIGFGLTEEVYAVGVMSKRNKELKGEHPPAYLIGLELPPYVITLLATWIGIMLAELIPSFILPALNTSLYALLIALIVPQLQATRQNLMIGLSATMSSWVLAPYLGNATVLFAMLIGAGIGSFVSRKSKKTREKMDPSDTPRGEVKL